MPVKIKQNININVNTTSKKNKTKTKKTTRRKKTKKNQMVSYNPSNNAYNPNARTMQTSMPSSGGGGSIIINKSGYDMKPYGQQMNENNVNNDMTKKIEDLNKKFTDGFNTYHNNTLLPALSNYHNSKIIPALNDYHNNTVIPVLNDGLYNYHNNTVLPVLKDGLHNYHNKTVKPIFDNMNKKTNNLNNKFDNLHQNYSHFEEGFNEFHNGVSKDMDHLYNRQNHIMNKINLDPLSPNYTNEFKSKDEDEIFVYPIIEDDSKVISNPLRGDTNNIINSSPPILEHFQDTNNFNYESKNDLSSEVNDPYDLNSVSTTNPITTNLTFADHFQNFRSSRNPPIPLLQYHPAEKKAEVEEMKIQPSEEIQPQLEHHRPELDYVLYPNEQFKSEDNNLNQAFDQKYGFEIKLPPQEIQTEDNTITKEPQTEDIMIAKEPQFEDNFGLNTDYFSESVLTKDIITNQSQQPFTEIFRDSEKNEENITKTDENDTNNDDLPTNLTEAFKTTEENIDELLPIPLAAMNMDKIKYINEEKKLSLVFSDKKSVKEYKNEIRKIMNEKEPDNDRKLTFYIPSRIMNQAEKAAANIYKKQLDDADQQAKTPNKVVHTEINLNKYTNKANLEQIYNQLGWEFNRNLTNHDLYQHLLTQEKRKFKVKKL